MTNLKPVSIYTLYPDELENLGYDISALTQKDFDVLGRRLVHTLDDGPLMEMLGDVADALGIPVP